MVVFSYDYIKVDYQIGKHISNFFKLIENLSFIVDHYFKNTLPINIMSAPSQAISSTTFSYVCSFKMNYKKNKQNELHIEVVRISWSFLGAKEYPDRTGGGRGRE